MLYLTHRNFKVDLRELNFVNWTIFGIVIIIEFGIEDKNSRILAK